jgi:adenine-specific DNA-methyltransferase
VHGDNLEALKSLLPEFAGRVQCIYIDPPYNTGNEGWAYNDNVNDPRLLAWLHRTVGKEADDLSRHDKWLCMMYPRLHLLHKLLADDGAIFISIDDNEVAHLRCVMDEVFGASNFVGNIIWQHSVQGKNDVKTISLHHNYTLVYGKSSFQIGKLTRTEEHNKAYSNPDNDPRGKWRSGDFRSPNYRENLRYDLVTPSGKTIAAPGKGWRWDKGTLAKRF